MTHGMVRDMAHPIAYLRKSKSDDPSREISREVQEAACRALAEHDGYHGELELLVDWDRSADEKVASRRTAYVELTRRIIAGDVSTLYAYSTDRLYRSLATFLRLTEAAKAHDVRIVTTREGVLGGDGSPMAQAFAQLTAVFAEMELNTAKARARGAYEARVARGDWIGRPQYGWLLKKDATGAVVKIPNPDQPLQPVIDAYVRANKRARTATRILNDELRIPAPFGGHWDRKSLLRVVTRERPDLLPIATATGQRAASADAPARLSKLLKCPCGRLLTPNRHVETRPGRVAGTKVSYYCAKGMATRAEHPRLYIAESKLMPWVLAEWGRYRESEDNPSMPRRDIAAERAVLAEKRTAVVQMRQDLIIDREEARRRIHAIDEEDAALNRSSPLVAWTLVERDGRMVRQIDLNFLAWPERKFNDVIRSIFAYIELDEEYRPLRAEWHDPSSRYADE
jgi:DNA invertase Pin-like site-specific DNA recombinase